MTKKEQRLFNVAKAISKTSTFGRIKIGAALISGAKIISVGVNSKKSHPIQKKLNAFRINSSKEPDSGFLRHNHIHAELEAILRAPYEATHDNNNNLTLYVYREGFKGQLRNCRPCPACMAAIREHGIKTIYYTTEDGYCKEEIA